LLRSGLFFCHTISHFSVVFHSSPLLKSPTT
jgi:hypothetical protein